MIHTNAVCCVCVFVRISAAQLARTESSRSLGSVLKNTRATTFLYFSPFKLVPFGSIFLLSSGGSFA